MPLTRPQARAPSALVERSARADACRPGSRTRAPRPFRSRWRRPSRWRALIEPSLPIPSAGDRVASRSSELVDRCPGPRSAAERPPPAIVSSRTSAVRGPGCCAMSAARTWPLMMSSRADRVRAARWVGICACPWCSTRKIASVADDVRAQRDRGRALAHQSTSAVGGADPLTGPPARRKRSADRLAGREGGRDHQATAGPRCCRSRSAPTRRSGPGEVRIAVRAAGINFADLMARSGDLPRRAAAAVRVGYEVAGEVESVGEGVESPAVGDRVMAGTRFGGYAELVTRAGRPGDRRCRRAQLRAGRRLPGQLRDRLRRAGDHGRAEAGRTGADPCRRRRRRNLRDADREADRRRDLRHRLGLQARRDPRPGRRSPDRLPKPGLRRRGDADHGRRRPRPDHRRGRPDQLSQGLPDPASGRAAGHVRPLGGPDRRQARHPGGAAQASRGCRWRRCRGGRACR